MPHRLRSAIAGLAVLIAMGDAPAFAQDATRGQAVFVADCSGCHSADKAADQTIAPSLFGVAGRKAGAAPGYAFSNALSTSGITWTPAKLDAFLAAPAAALPGNQMYFEGLPTASDRADLIAYLARLK